MPFLLNGNPTESEISEAVNYLLANFDSSVSSDPNTGQISGPSGEIIGYLYQYIAVKYADSFDGSVNFSNSPANRLYFGIRNNNDAAESSNPADYIWSQVTGGFGLTKSLWYISTGGRQIQFAISVSAPDTGWLVDPGSSIDLDVVTSGNIPVIAEAFVPYFTPNTLQVPRSGNPLSPVFTNITPVMYATDAGAVVPFVDAQTDTAVNFTNGTWRIGNSSTTGYADISKTNITIGNPNDAGDYAQWPIPTAMSASPAYITVPVRYKNNLGVVAQAGVATVQLVFTDPGATGQPGPTLDINGYTSFVQNAGGAYTPATATLSASPANVTAPTYSWTISGATPTSATTASVVITPTSNSTGVSVSLTVNGTNLLSPLTRTLQMPVVYDGAPGQAGANGVMSAFPSIYIWTGSSVPPTRPTTNSTYTWSTGAYTAPTLWSTSAPTNTTPGNYLWIITIPLNASATTVTSPLNWTDVANPIRAIAYNGANGTSGTNGSATFLVTRTANDSSAPTNAETTAAIGRNPVAGDIVTVSYNNANNAVVYRYTTSWVTQSTYITGSLIVQNTITADKMITGLMSSDNVLTRGLTVRDNSGNILLASGNPLNFANITPASGWLNSNISINSNGTLTGAGGGSVSLSGLGAGSFATLSQITSSNATTYIAGAAIGTAQVGVLTANNIGADTIDANKLTSITVNASKNITVGTAAVSDTTMTGSGAILNGNGTAAIGNATTNISFNGTQMTLNGNVVATGNINLNAVTVPFGSELTADVDFTGDSSGPTTVTLTEAILNTGGAPLYVSISYVAQSQNPSPFLSSFSLTILINDAIVATSNNFVTSTPTSYIRTFENFISNPGSGNFNFKVNATASARTVVRIYSENSLWPFSPGATTFFALGVKR
jgi:hypothetical protein